LGFNPKKSPNEHLWLAKNALFGSRLRHFFPELKGKSQKTLGTNDALVSLAVETIHGLDQTKINHYDINQRKLCRQWGGS
jgi:hypothetical protein